TAPTFVGTVLTCLLWMTRRQWCDGGHGAGRKRAQHTRGGAGGGGGAGASARTGPWVCAARPGWACAGPAPSPKPVTAAPESNAPAITRLSVWVVFMTWFLLESESVFGVGNTADDAQVAAPHLRRRREIHAKFLRRLASRRG